ncbi:hypothetical protein [Flavobacterium sp.]|uniref:hypothetical protein n=1 Tax=Flavobacterium sp. TaxID=239 RepID=UPI00352969D9
MKQLFIFFLFLFSFSVMAQHPTDLSTAEKEVLYAKYSKEVKNYSLKQFEELFFEFQKKGFSTTLTKDEFYSYTIKIAAFSERYAGLYPKEKEAAQKNKEMWLNKSYVEYLENKKPKKQHEN